MAPAAAGCTTGPSRLGQQRQQQQVAAACGPAPCMRRWSFSAVRARCSLALPRLEKTKAFGFCLRRCREGTQGREGGTRARHACCWHEAAAIAVSSRQPGQRFGEPWPGGKQEHSMGPRSIPNCAPPSPGRRAWSSVSAARVLAPPASPSPPPPPRFLPSAALRFSALRPAFFLRWDLPPSAMAAARPARPARQPPLAGAPWGAALSMRRCSDPVTKPSCSSRAWGQQFSRGKAAQASELQRRWRRRRLCCAAAAGGGRCPRHAWLSNRVLGRSTHEQARSGPSGSAAPCATGSPGTAAAATHLKGNLQYAENDCKRFPHCMHVLRPHAVAGATWGAIALHAIFCDLGARLTIYQVRQQRLLPRLRAGRCARLLCAAPAGLLPGRLRRGACHEALQ